MLNVGLTGGIGAGKSTVAERLTGLGAVLVDSDTLAREVIEPGTDGLTQVAAAFGTGVLDADGRLDRAAMAQRVFADPEARARLEGIIHPLVRSRSAELAAAAPPDAIVVSDVPLLAEVGLAPTFDLVLVVEAPHDLRLERLTARGLPPDKSAARIAAQVSDEVRRAVAGAVIDNSGDIDTVNAAVDALWRDRLVGFEDNKRARRIVKRSETVPLLPYQDRWPGDFARTAARLRHLLGDTALRIDHIGSTAVPGLAAKDVVDVQVTVADLTVADSHRETLAAAGFPATDVTTDGPHPASPDPADWAKRLHGGTDPALPLHIHIRTTGSLGARYALLFRDWLRADSGARNEYAALKWRLKETAKSTTDYAALKEPLVTEMLTRAETWATTTGWNPPD